MHLCRLEARAETAALVVTGSHSHTADLDINPPARPFACRRPTGRAVVEGGKLPGCRAAKPGMSIAANTSATCNLWASYSEIINASAFEQTRRWRTAMLTRIVTTLAGCPDRGDDSTSRVRIRRRPPDWRMRVRAAASMMAGRCVKVRRPADRRACRLGAGASIPRAAVRADARREDRRCERGRRRAKLSDRRR